jgi:hypothetical protein
MTIETRRHDLGIETVLMTGHPNEAGGLQVSGVRHLNKPFRLDTFMKIIGEVLPSA